MSKIHRHGHGYWKSKQNRLLELNRLAKKIGFTQPEDWYQVSKATFEKHGLRRLLIIYGNSPPKLVMSLIQNSAGWKWWRFVRAPRNLSMSKRIRRQVLSELGKRHGFRKLNDWYAITQKHFQTAAEKRLLLRYKGSPSVAVSDLIHGGSKLNFWKYKNVPKGVWLRRSNLTTYFDWLTQELSIKKPEDWYAVSGQNIKDNYGDVLLRAHYGGSVIKMITDLARKPPPAHMWKYGKASQRYWDSAANRRAYLEWLGGVLNIRSVDDWYRVRSTDFIENRGGGFIKHYAMSHIAGIREFVKNPDGWHDFLFVGAPKKYWNKKSNRTAYTKWLGKKIGFRSKADWYRIASADFLRYSGNGLLAIHYGGSPPKAVVEAFPNGKWDPSKFFERSKNQKRLYDQVRRIFPKEKVLWNYKHPDLKFSSGRLMELDIYIPAKNLAFEYQGEQHFHSRSFFSSKSILKQQKARDSEKRAACLGANPPIKLIEIDYKWDALEQTVRALISGRRDVANRK